MSTPFSSPVAGPKVLPSGFHANNKYEVMKQDLKTGERSLFQVAEVLLEDIEKIEQFQGGENGVKGSIMGIGGGFAFAEGQDIRSRIVSKMGSIAGVGTPDEIIKELQEATGPKASEHSVNLQEFDQKRLERFVEVCLASDGVNARIYSPATYKEKSAAIILWPLVLLHAIGRFPFWLASKISRFGKTASSLQVHVLVSDLKTTLDKDLTTVQLKSLVDRIVMDYEKVKFYASDSSKVCLSKLKEYVDKNDPSAALCDIDKNELFTLISEYLLENRNGNTTDAPKNSGKKLYRIMCEHLETFVANPNVFVAQKET